MISVHRGCDIQNDNTCNMIYPFEIKSSSGTLEIKRLEKQIN